MTSQGEYAVNWLVCGAPSAKWRSLEILGLWFCHRKHEWCIIRQPSRAVSNHSYFLGCLLSVQSSPVKCRCRSLVGSWVVQPWLCCFVWLFFGLSKIWRRKNKMRKNARNNLAYILSSSEICIIYLYDLEVLSNHEEPNKHASRAERQPSSRVSEHVGLHAAPPGHCVCVLLLQQRCCTDTLTLRRHWSCAGSGTLPWFHQACQSRRTYRRSLCAVCSQDEDHSVCPCVRVGRQLISQEALFSFLHPPRPPNNHNSFDSEQSYFLLLAAVEKQSDNKMLLSLYMSQRPAVWLGVNQFDDGYHTEIFITGGYVGCVCVCLCVFVSVFLSLLRSARDTQQEK